MKDHDNHGQKGKKEEKQIVIPKLKRRPPMLNIKSLIRAMTLNDSNAFLELLKINKASRYAMLYGVYRFDPVRGEPLEADYLTEAFNMKRPTFNTTKSRLNEKLQDWLADRFLGQRVKLARKLDAIPRLVYGKIQPLVAIAILLSLEKRLMERDMPEGLIRVYDALRRLLAQESSYHRYTRYYHRSVSYALAIGKADGLLMEYCRKLGEHCLSKDKKSLDTVTGIKEEIASLAGMYNSNRLRSFRLLADINFALYVPAGAANSGKRASEPVEDMLAELRKIVEPWPDDERYAKIARLCDLLSFEYYHRAGLADKAAQYYDKVNACLPMMMRMQSMTYVSNFLLSRLEVNMVRGTSEGLEQENQVVLQGFRPAILDHVSLTNYMIYMAVCWFHAHRYKMMMRVLHELMRRVVFRELAHAELEAFVLLSLAKIKEYRYDDAREQLRALGQRVRRMNEEKEYRNILALIDYLRAVIKRNQTLPKTPVMSVTRLRTRFCRLNTGEREILGYLNWSKLNLLRPRAVRLEDDMDEG